WAAFADPRARLAPSSWTCSRGRGSRSGSATQAARTWPPGAGSWPERPAGRAPPYGRFNGLPLDCVEALPEEAAGEERRIMPPVPLPAPSEGLSAVSRVAIALAVALAIPAAARAEEASSPLADSWQRAASHSDPAPL